MQLSSSKCQASGKTRYNTPGDAKEAMLRIKGKGNIWNNATRKRQKRRSGKAAQCRYYHCKHCGGFHLTKSPAALSQKTIERKFERRVRTTKGLVITPEEAAKWKADGLPFPEPKKPN